MKTLIPILLFFMFQSRAQDSLKYIFDEIGTDIEKALRNTNKLDEANEWGKTTEWDKASLERANTAKDIDYYTEEEKNVIFYMNLARMNGPLFIKTFLQTYIDSERKHGYSKSYTKEINKYYNSLVDDLQSYEKSSPLIPRQNLYEAAKKHGKKLRRTGKDYHSSYGFGENLDFGSNNGFVIVIDLLIDMDIPDVGHRKNILSSGYKYTGVSINRHRKWGYVCVIEFL